MSLRNEIISREIILQENPFYLYRIPIAIIFSIIIYIFVCSYTKNLNKYVNTVILPLLIFLIVLGLIEETASGLIPNSMIKGRAMEMDKIEESFIGRMNEAVTQMNMD